MTTALSAHQLTKTYGDAPALGPVDVEVRSGERVVLIGHNGSGKTTLLRIAGGMLEATSGTVSVVGNDIGSLDARAFTSYLGDTPVFYDDLTVWEHLEYIARLHDTEGWDSHAVELLEMVGLSDRADQLPITFSRGLRQKAAIALAFVRPFELMLVDEPFVGLDQSGKEALLELFRRAHEDGATLVVATHELTTVKEAERVIALRDGTIIFDGPTDQADPDLLVVR